MKSSMCNSTDETFAKADVIEKTETQRIEQRSDSGNKAGKRTIICMEDIRALKSDVLEVEAGTIFTPLAKDYLKEKRIRIVFRE